MLNRASSLVGQFEPDRDGRQRGRYVLQPSVSAFYSCWKIGLNIVRPEYGFAMAGEESKWRRPPGISPTPVAPNGIRNGVIDGPAFSDVESLQAGDKTIQV